MQISDLSHFNKYFAKFTFFNLIVFLCSPKRQKKKWQWLIFFNVRTFIFVFSGHRIMLFLEITHENVQPKIGYLTSHSFLKHFRAFFFSRFYTSLYNIHGHVMVISPRTVCSCEYVFMWESAPKWHAQKRVFSHLIVF